MIVGDILPRDEMGELQQVLLPAAVRARVGRMQRAAVLSRMQLTLCAAFMYVDVLAYSHVHVTCQYFYRLARSSLATLF